MPGHGFSVPKFAGQRFPEFFAFVTGFGLETYGCLCDPWRGQQYQGGTQRMGWRIAEVLKLNMTSESVSELNNPGFVVEGIRNSWNGLKCLTFAVKIVLSFGNFREPLLQLNGLNQGNLRASPNANPPQVRPYSGLIIHHDPLRKPFRALIPWEGEA